MASPDVHKRGSVQDLPIQLGLHRLGKHFRKRHLEAHCKQLTERLEEAIAATTPPLRRQDFKLDRKANENIDPTSRERCWEQKIWQTWRKVNVKAIPHCWSRIVSYQVPLFDNAKKDGWGHIDLLGISNDGLPVIVELKKDPSRNHLEEELNTETPARMIVEAAAYAIALQHNWQTIRPRFVDHLRTVGHTEQLVDRVPSELTKVPIVGAAPAAYWTHWLPLTTKGLSVNENTWIAFKGLLAALSDAGYPSTFASIVGDLKDGSRLQAGCLYGFPMV